MDYKIKTIPEDFVVQESQCMYMSPVRRDFHYTIFLLIKKGYTTFEAVEAIANFGNISQGEIGYAGLKDEDGLTFQNISVNADLILTDKINDFNSKYGGTKKYISLKVIGYSDTRIKIGQLQGNAFNIKIRNVDQEVGKCLKERTKKRVFFPNYYDTQRFGIPNMPKRTHLVGKALYEKDFTLAAQYLKEGMLLDHSNQDEYLDAKEFFNQMDRGKLSFYYNAYTSTMYNAFLNDYIRANTQYVELIYDEISFALPINGFSFAQSENEIEKICVPRYDIDKNMELTLKYYYRFTYINTIFHVQKVSIDALNDGKIAIDVDFFLPPGCYATMAIKQFMCDIKQKLIDERRA